MAKGNKLIALVLLLSFILILGTGCRKKAEAPIDEPPKVEENQEGEEEVEEAEKPEEEKEAEEGVKNQVGIYPGNTAIPFQLKNVKEQTVSSNQFKGKPTIIVFWVTWSPEALEQIEALNQLKQQYKNDIAMIGIHSSGFDILAPQELVNFLKGRNDVIEMLIDEKSEVNAAYFVGNYPTTYFIDAEGKIVKSITTPLNKEQLAVEIKKSFNK